MVGQSGMDLIKSILVGLKEINIGEMAINLIISGRKQRRGGLKMVSIIEPKNEKKIKKDLILKWMIFLYNNIEI